MRNLINLSSLVLMTMMLAGGQFLFKQLGLALRGHTLVDGLWLIARMPTLYLALAIYGSSTVLWIWILSRISLARAYPWVAAGVVIVPLIGWLYFGERLRPLFWVGIVLILAGILLVQQSSSFTM